MGPIHLIPCYTESVFVTARGRHCLGLVVNMWTMVSCG